MTDASVHDSQVVEALLTDDNTASGVWADSAYRSKDIEKKVKAKGLTSRIHRKAYRNRPLRDWQKVGSQRAVRGSGHEWSMSSGRSTVTWAGPRIKSGAGYWFAASG